MKKRLLSALLLTALLLTTLFAFPLGVGAADDEGLTFSASYLYAPNQSYNRTPNTFEAWINLPKSASGSRAGIILGNYGDSAPCINFEIHPNGRPRLYWCDTSGVTDWIFTKVNVCTGEWLHLTIVRDEAKNEVRCYVDGALAATLKITKDTRDLRCTEPFVLGGDWRAENSMFFRGRIRSVAVYSDVRTEDEINGDMIEPDLDDALIAHYDLSTLTEDGLLEDLSGNGYDIKKGKQALWIPEEDKEPVTDFDYTFVAVGDTQVLAQKHQDRFHLVYDWIMDNKDEKNIKFVMGLGDITETSADKEWEIAMENILRMEGVIPFSLVRGNHDSTASFNKHFPYSEYEYLVDGTYNESMINSWQKFEVGARKFIVFTLDYGASDAVLNWAADIIEKHPDYNVILTTHCYLFRDGTTLDQGDVCPPATTGGYNNGDHMWDKLVKNHENIVLVINGHDPCSRIVMAQDEGEHGNVVTQLLIDPQGVDATMGGLGMVAALHFSEDSDEIQVEYYSTFKEQYFKEQNQFTFTVDFVNEDPIDESLSKPEDENPTPSDEDKTPENEDKTPENEDNKPATDDTANEQQSATVGVSSLILIIIIAAAVIVALVVALVVVVLKSKKK